MLSIEQVRVEAEEFGQQIASALKVWVEIVGDEPSSFVKDEDGDTSAEGPFEDSWLVVQIIGGYLVCTLSGSEDNFELMKFGSFVGSLKTVEYLISRLGSFVANHKPGNLKMQMHFAKEVESLQEGAVFVRRLIPELPAPEKLFEVDYRYVARIDRPADEGVSYIHQARWRNGRRVVSSDGDSGQASETKPAVGCTQAVETLVQDGDILSNPQNALLDMFNFAMLMKKDDSNVD